MLACCIVYSFLLYGNTIRGEFVADDTYFYSRPEYRTPGFLLKLWTEPFDKGAARETLYRPITAVTYSLNYLFFGDSPVSFHIVNIILNGLAGFLVYLVTRRLFRNEVLSMVTALLFLSFPIHTEAVANIKGREEILAAIFVFASWILFLKEKRWAMFLWILAVLSKEFMIVAPVVFFVTSKTIRWVWWFIVALIGVVALRFAVLGEYTFGKSNLTVYINPLIGESFVTRLFTAPKLAFLYIAKTFVPLNLSATYSFDHLPVVRTPWWAIAGFITVLLIIVFNKHIKSYPVRIGLFVFIIFYSIFSNVLFASGDFFAERWMYVPSVGLAMIAGWLFFWISQKQKAIWVVFAVIILWYGYMTYQRNTVWLTQKNWTESLVRDAPDSARARAVLARQLISEGKIDASREHITAGLKIAPNSPRIREVAAVVAFSDGQYVKAKEHALVALNQLPLDAARTAAITYGLVLVKEGKYDEAIAIGNKFTDSFLLAVSYYKKGEKEKAREYGDWGTLLEEF